MTVFNGNLILTFLKWQKNKIKKIRYLSSGFDLTGWFSFCFLFQSCTYQNFLSQGTTHWRRDSITNLSVLVQNVTIKAIRVRKSLGPSTFPDTYNSCPFWVQNPSLNHKTEEKSQTEAELENKFHQQCSDEFNTCLPMGSGLVTVVEKNPSHSSRPYNPAQ